MERNLGIYIHIPFCIRKCNYCDFTSFGGCGEGEKNRYVDALVRQIDQSAEGVSFSEETEVQGVLPIGERLVDSVFFGGGTPSLLSPDQVGRVMEALRRGFSLTKDCEITMEANPGTVTEESLAAYRSLGINRLSFGVQSMEEEVLHLLGRIHSAEEAERSVAMARHAGFSDLNLDLMFGIPGQTMAQWERTLAGTAALDPEHISFYSLQVEEGTPIYDDIKNGRLLPLSDEEDRAMYHRALAFLRERGYHQYEISNGAKPGKESRHNRKYWTMQEYLGFGISAHGFLNGVRYSCGDDREAYIRALEQGRSPVVWAHANTKRESAAEFMFTGLRLTEGVDLQEFYRRFGMELEEMYREEMKELWSYVRGGFAIVEQEKDGKLRRLALTERGMDISNPIMALFV